VKRTGAIIQARCGSTRMPNKVLMPLPFSGEVNVLQHILNRCQKSKTLDDTYIATTTESEDDCIEEIYSDRIFRGSAENVLSRFYEAATEYGLDIVVRLTADNPCIDAAIIDYAVMQHIKYNYDYSKTIGLPVGTNIQVVSVDALRIAHHNAQDSYEKEHVIPYISNRQDQFNIGLTEILTPKFSSNTRLTLDYPSDYAMLNVIFTNFADRYFSLFELAEFLEQYPWIIKINPNYQKQLFNSHEAEYEAALRILRNAELTASADLISKEIKTLQSDKVNQ